MTFWREVKGIRKKLSGALVESESVRFLHYEGLADDDGERGPTAPMGRCGGILEGVTSAVEKLILFGAIYSSLYNFVAVFVGWKR